MEKIFVYGSLMSSFWNHDKVLKNRVKHLVKGQIKGKLYHLPEGYPAVVEGEESVYGEVCTIAQDKIIKSLDLLEGYLGEGQDNLYERQKRKVILENGQEEECWAYIYVNKEYAKTKGIGIVHGDWKKFMGKNKNK
ncbi:MAG: gamma-glutamylcyclotransferase family protein [Cellulosilyticaceae bacterium]